MIKFYKFNWYKITNHYIKYGHKNFYIAIGYKYEVILKYFRKNFHEIKNYTKQNYTFYDYNKKVEFNLI